MEGRRRRCVQHHPDPSFSLVHARSRMAGLLFLDMYCPFGQPPSCSHFSWTYSPGFVPLSASVTLRGRLHTSRSSSSRLGHLSSRRQVWCSVQSVPPPTIEYVGF